MIKNSLKISLFVILFPFFSSCKTSNHTQHKKDTVVNTLTIIEKNNSTEIFNQEKTKLLILNYKVKMSPIITYYYKVIDFETKKELKNGVFMGTDLNWLDNSTLKGTPYIGMVRKESLESLSNDTKKNASFTKIPIH